MLQASKCGLALSPLNCLTPSAPKQRKSGGCEFDVKLTESCQHLNFCQHSNAIDFAGLNQCIAES